MAARATARPASSAARSRSPQATRVPHELLDSAEIRRRYPAIPGARRRARLLRAERRRGVPRTRAWRPSCAWPGKPARWCGPTRPSCDRALRHGVAVTTDKGRIEAARVVLTAGAWTPGLAGGALAAHGARSTARPCCGSRPTSPRCTTRRGARSSSGCTAPARRTTCTASRSLPGTPGVKAGSERYGRTGILTGPMRPRRAGSRVARTLRPPRRRPPARRHGYAAEGGDLPLHRHARLRLRRRPDAGRRRVSSSRPPVPATASSTRPRWARCWRAGGRPTCPLPRASGGWRGSAPDGDAPAHAPGRLPQDRADRAARRRLAASGGDARRHPGPRPLRAHRPRAGSGQVRRLLLRRPVRAVRPARRQLRRLCAARRPDQLPGPDGGAAGDGAR